MLLADDWTHSKKKRSKQVCDHGVQTRKFDTRAQQYLFLVTCPVVVVTVLFLHGMFLVK